MPKILSSRYVGPIVYYKCFSTLVVRKAKPHDAIAELLKKYPSIGAVCLQREVS